MNDYPQDLDKELKGDPEYATLAFWKRLALLDEDFEAFDLLRLPVKMSDKRGAQSQIVIMRLCVKVVDSL